MQCHEVRDLADAFIGEELLVETAHAIVRHLESCPECRREIAARRALRLQLRRAVIESADLAPRPEWLEALGPRLRHPATPVVPGRAGRGRWLALAATLLLVAGGAALTIVSGWRGEAALAALARLALGDHRNCAVRFNLAEKPIPLAEAAARYDAAYRVLETTPPAAITLGTHTIDVVERHSCVFEGRRFAHVVMKYKGELVSLLVAADGAGPLTRVPAHAAGGRALDSLIGGHVIYAHAGGHAVFFVADTSADVLAEVADATSGEVLRRLAGV